MLSRMLVASSVLFGLATVVPAVSQEPFDLTGSWWQEPAHETRRTTLVASFDSTESSDADYAREMKLSGGYAMNADVPGKHGSATQVAATGGHLHYVGGSNIQTARGTVRMHLKGDIWFDEMPRWLFEARAADRIGIRREPGKLSLIFTRERGTDVFSRLDLEIGSVSADKWHSVVASWDLNAGLGWIALDGKGVKGEMTFSQDLRTAHVIYVGAGAFSMHPGGINPPGLLIDDLVLYDVPLPRLEAKPVALPAEDQKLLPAAEAGARKCLNFIADRQRGGGWQWSYTWPTLIPTASPAREGASPDIPYANIDKGNSSMAVVYPVLYGYEVLGDQRLLDVAQRLAEVLLAGQDQQGFWAYGYYVTPRGVEGKRIDSYAKLQDHVQSFPMYFFCYLYRLTGDERCMEAVKRAGEFYLAAQNPNGSWSHCYDPRDRIGKTATGLPQGGELNDGAMNDAIDVMAMMYHMTGEAKYVQAMKRAGDWLIEAQGRDMPLWADQYDKDNNPIWAREFEPPAYGRVGTRLACEALREMYRFSGDERYLDPIRKTVAWMEENLPDGMMWNYLEPGTGRPIAGWYTDRKPGKIYYLDDPKQFAYMKTVPTGHWNLEQHEMLGTTKGILKSALGETPRSPEVTVEKALERLPFWRRQARERLETQNEAGVWVVRSERMNSIGPVVNAACWELRPILRYIEVARVALGELEPVYRGYGDRGYGDYRSAAFPQADWYNVNWSENARSR